MIVWSVLGLLVFSCVVLCLVATLCAPADLEDMNTERL